MINTEQTRRLAYRENLNLTNNALKNFKKKAEIRLVKLEFCRYASRRILFGETKKEHVDRIKRCSMTDEEWLSDRP